MTPPQANRRDLGNLTSLGPRAGNAALAPQTRLPLERSGGQGRGRKWTSEPSSLYRDQQGRGQRISRSHAWPWQPQGPLGSGLGMGYIVGKCPFPTICTPCFQLLNMGNHTSYRLSRVANTLLIPDPGFTCLTPVSEPLAQLLGSSHGLLGGESGATSSHISASSRTSGVGGWWSRVPVQSLLPEPCWAP